jgi:hypothetical protein
MKFLFDHDVPDELSHFLRQLGHEVRRLREELPTAAQDADVLAHAIRQGWPRLEAFLKEKKNAQGPDKIPATRPRRGPVAAAVGTQAP